MVASLESILGESILVNYAFALVSHKCSVFTYLCIQLLSVEHLLDTRRGVHQHLELKEIRRKRWRRLRKASGGNSVENNCHCLEEAQENLILL